MKRHLGFALLVPAILLFANPFIARVQAQRRFERQDRDRVCFYTDAYYRGDSFCANPGDGMPNVGGRFNDRISSIRIFGRAEVTVFADEGFGAARRTFNRDVPNLHDLGFNDLITSFQVSGGARGGGFGNERRGIELRNGACFYTDEDFRGESFCLNSGDRDRNVGAHFNDRISSIRLFGRARVYIFSDENYGGNRREINRDAPHLRFFNDRITSIQVR
jgi:hypothetical protein